MPPDRDLLPVILAGDSTVVVAVALSLLGFPSGVEEVAVAVLLRTVAAGTVGATLTVRVKVSLPTENDGLEHETVPGSPGAGVVHAQPDTSGIETKLSPAGSVSLHDALAAASGPLFVTVIVYVRFAPVFTGSGESTLVTDRSAIANSG